MMMMTYPTTYLLMLLLMMRLTSHLVRKFQKSPELFVFANSADLQHLRM